MRVLITIARLDRADGGPPRSTTGLADALAGCGADVCVFALREAGRSTADLVLPADARVRVDLRNKRRADPLAHGFAAGLADACDRFRPDVLHDNGVWLGSNHRAIAIARARSLPLVVSSRGMLTEWSYRHKRWKKFPAWWAYQKRDLSSASLVHATGKDEADDLRKLGVRRPIAVIPNAVDPPPAGLARPAAGAAAPYALFLSRMNPKKGVIELLDAWARVRPPGWRLVLAGPDEGGYAQRAVTHARDLGLAGSVEFPGPVYGGAKWTLLSGASCLILPSYSENFGLVVAEALACGVPVLTTRGTPWEELESRNCGWWIDMTPDALADALRRAVTLGDAERAAMGERGKRLVEDRYLWPAVARQMMEVYDWVLRRGPRPACVRTDLHSEVGRSILRGAAQPAADAAGSAGESPTRAAAERPVVGVAHVVSELPEAAGTTVFCVELCTGIAAAGHRVGMAIGRWTDDPDYPLNYAGVRLVWPRRLNWQGRPLPFVRRVGSAIRELSDGIRAELVHVHALWEAVPHAGVGFARAAGLPLVFSPHGMSTPWALAHHWWRKRAAWLAYQRRDLLAATVLHATAHAEAEDLRRLGFEQPIAVVPLGVHLPRPEGGFRRSGVGRQRTILFLSRIHPKKGLFNLVDAWAAVRQPGWRVVIAGPDEADHRAEVEKRAVRCGVADDFHFVGPVFGDDKDGHYRDAELFVLPSYSENFGVVVADALAYGVPAITTRATPWREVQEHRCGWWIETGVAPLAEALRAAMACTPQERAAMGERGRALVEERYAWPSVVAQMVSVYEWILHRGGMPACMRME